MSIPGTSEPRRIFEDTSPNRNLIAIVEDDGDSLFLYLHGAADSGFGTRACWVRNLKPAPAAVDPARLASGLAPMMPRGACAHPDGAPRPLSPLLRVVWLEEGDSVALYERDELLCVIPPWSGEHDFPGYARDCLAKSPLAWPLEGEGRPEGLLARVAGAEAFWKRWQDNGPWEASRSASLDALREAFGEEAEVVDLEMDRWPPRAAAIFDRDDEVVIATIGMGIRPQPRVELELEDPLQACRVELACALDKRLVDGADLATFVRWLGAMTEVPWARYRWLGPGHVLDGTQPPLAPEGQDTLLLVAARDTERPVPLPLSESEPVTLLWVVAVGESDVARCESRGLGAALAARGPSPLRWN